MGVILVLHNGLLTMFHVLRIDMILSSSHHG